jgi:hypothetical protein
MKKEQIFLVAVLSACTFAFIVANVLVNKADSKLGTNITQNTATQSFIDGSDLYQNVQAMAERMAGLTEGQLLQADSQGRMQAVSALSGVVFTENVESVTVSNTIAVAESGATFYLSGATSTHTLPAVASSAGTVYRFVVGASVTGDITIVTADAGNTIEGALIVAGAVVDCDAEDTITIVADGENLGDFVELRSNGTKWFIGASGALTASKMTCSAT